MKKIFPSDAPIAEIEQNHKFYKNIMKKFFFFWTFFIFLRRAATIKNKTDDINFFVTCDYESHTCRSVHFLKLFLAFQFYFFNFAEKYAHNIHQVEPHLSRFNQSAIKKVNFFFSSFASTKRLHILNERLSRGVLGDANFPSKAQKKTISSEA